MQKITKSEEYVSRKALKDGVAIKLLPENTVLIAMYGQGKTRWHSESHCTSTISSHVLQLPNNTGD